MNRDRVKELLPVMQAFWDGVDIQFSITNSGWKYFGGNTPAFENSDISWRIKPEPFECWINVFNSDDFSEKIYSTKENAQNNRALGVGRTIHMREVE